MIQRRLVAGVFLAMVLLLIVATVFFVYPKMRKHSPPEFVSNVPEAIAKKADWRKGQVACRVGHKNKILKIGQKIDTTNLILSKIQWGESYKTYYTGDYNVYYLVKSNRLVGIYSKVGNVMAYPTARHGLSHINLHEFADDPPYSVADMKFELFNIPCSLVKRNSLETGAYLVISTNKYFMLIAEHTESQYATVTQGIFDINIIEDEMHIKYLRQTQIADE